MGMTGKGEKILSSFNFVEIEILFFLVNAYISILSCFVVLEMDPRAFRSSHTNPNHFGAMDFISSWID